METSGTPGLPVKRVGFLFQPLRLIRGDKQATLTGLRISVAFIAGNPNPAGSRDRQGILCTVLLCLSTLSAYTQNSATERTNFYVTFNSGYNIGLNNFITVIAPTAGTVFTIRDAAGAVVLPNQATFYTNTSDPNYVIATRQYPETDDVLIELINPSGFIAYMTGYGPAESYIYSAGSGAFNLQNYFTIATKTQPVSDTYYSATDAASGSGNQPAFTATNGSRHNHRHALVQRLHRHTDNLYNYDLFLLSTHQSPPADTGNC